MADPSESVARWSPRMVIVLAVAVLAIAVLYMAALSSAFLGSPPRDASLIARFRELRPALDACAAAAVADSELSIVYRDPIIGFHVTVRGTPQDRTLSSEEVGSTGRSRFRALLAKARIPVLRRTPEGAVKLEIMHNYDVRKGFFYSTRLVEPLAASLDTLDHAVGSGYLRAAYRPVGPGWYLFLEARE